MGELPKETEELSQPDLEKPKIERQKTAKSTKPKEPKQPIEPKSAKFPVEAKVNRYGFVYLDGDILAAWGLSKGTIQRLSIDLKEGALIIRKV